MATSEDPNNNKKPVAEAGYSAEKMIIVDRAKMRRHDEAHEADLKLAAELAAHWAMHVQAEHRPN